MSVLCICGCGQRAVHLHHCVTRQELRKHGGDADDERNLVPVAFACHGAHHGRSRPLPVHVLPSSVFDFAAEVMGPGAAYEYIARTYDGTDLRLERLLGEDNAA